MERKFKIKAIDIEKNLLDALKEQGYISIVNSNEDYTLMGIPSEEPSDLVERLKKLGKVIIIPKGVLSGQTMDYITKTKDIYLNRAFGISRMLLDLKLIFLFG